MAYNIEDIAELVEIGETEADVYDVVMADAATPYFFANNILVHNSSYFSIAALIEHLPKAEQLEAAIELADAIAEQVNDSFPAFMRQAFNCQPGYDELIKAVREVVASAGIFIAKKKYILKVEDLEGLRIEEGSSKEIKTQGSDLKLSTVPKTIKTMLKEIVLMVLKGEPKSKIDDRVLRARREIVSNDEVNPLDYASVTSVKQLDLYQSQYDAIEAKGRGKARLPGNARASINYNRLIRELKVDSPKIIGGNKIKVLYLKPNEYGFTSIAFPSDLEHLPTWFTAKLEVDLAQTEKKLVDTKLENILHPVGMEVPTEQSVLTNRLMGF